MSSCSPFSVNFSESAQDFFNKAQNLIQQHKGSISGGASGGAFSIPFLPSKITGNFSISGQKCTIEVTDCPFFLNCGEIESYVNANI